MANTITAQTIIDGPRNLVIKTYLVGDGTPAQESDTILVNVSDFVDSLGATLTRVKIMKIESATAGGWSVQLAWDATTNVPIVNIAGDVSDFDRDYSSFGGLINNAGTGITGDILWTTTGIGANDEGHITLYMKKQ